MDELAAFKRLDVQPVANVCNWWIADSPVFKTMPAKRTPWKSSEARRQIGQLRNRIHVSTGARLRGGD